MIKTACVIWSFVVAHEFAYEFSKVRKVSTLKIECKIECLLSSFFFIFSILQYSENFDSPKSMVHARILPHILSIYSCFPLHGLCHCRFQYRLIITLRLTSNFNGKVSIFQPDKIHSESKSFLSVIVL